MDNKLVTREQAEKEIDQFFKDHPQAEYAMYGEQRKGNEKFYYYPPREATKEFVMQKRKDFHDIAAIPNPNKKESMKEATNKKFFKYNGPILDKYWEKPMDYTEKDYVRAAANRNQAILLLKKAIAPDIHMGWNDFFLDPAYLVEVDNKKEIEEPEEKPICPTCGRRLNDSGICPVCDDGEEDYESLGEAFSYEEVEPNFDIVLLDNWIDKLNSHEEEKHNVFPETFSYEKGKRYFKVIKSFNGKNRSVFAFVDADGNIYKPAGWNAPAKGVRARIDNNPPLESIDLYSGRYLKGMYGINK